MPEKSFTYTPDVYKNTSDWCLPGEEWRPIPIPTRLKYEASSYGRIRRPKCVVVFGHKTGNKVFRRPEDPIVLKISRSPDGRLSAPIFLGNSHCIRVSRLVAMAFLPKPKNGDNIVCHIDDNPLHNRPENLYWGNHVSNSKDKKRNGNTPAGESHWRAQLTERDVRNIKSMLKQGETNALVAKMYRVSCSTISAIRVGRNWAHI